MRDIDGGPAFESSKELIAICSCVPSRAGKREAKGRRRRWGDPVSSGFCRTSRILISRNRSREFHEDKGTTLPLRPFPERYDASRRTRCLFLDGFSCLNSFPSGRVSQPVAGKSSNGHSERAGPKYHFFSSPSLLPVRLPATSNRRTTMLRIGLSIVFSRSLRTSQCMFNDLNRV